MDTINENTNVQKKYTYQFSIGMSILFCVMLLQLYNSLPA